jgi:thymidylate kinase
MVRTPDVVTGAQPLGLVTALCDTLDRQAVRYCHWKSTDALERSWSGENDLDLLVAERDIPVFEASLRALGFKEAIVPAAQRLPGVRHLYGVDEPSGRLVDVHLHERLILGDDATKNYRLPIEDAYLSSVTRRDPFMVPDPELEFAIFALRMMIKHGSPEAIASGRGSLSRAERDEMHALEDATDPVTRWRSLHHTIPTVDRALLFRCLDTFGPTQTIPARVGVWRDLERRLAIYERRPRVSDVWLQLSRRLIGRSRRLVHRPRRWRMADGGSVIAIVGSDGSGKSTMTDALAGWLGPVCTVQRLHLGKPPRSASWIALRAAMHAGRRLGLTATAPPVPTGAIAAADEQPTVPRLLMDLLTTRDRLRAARRARRSADGGVIVLCDRYPLPQLSVDGPRGAPAAGGTLGPMSRGIVARERRLAARIPPPDVVVVLAVEPDVARRRRPDADPAVIDARATEILDAAWDPEMLVVDAARPFDDVFADVRRGVWSRL